MTDKMRIGVVGSPDGWSSETLADRIEARTGHRLLIDMGRVEADFERRTITFEGTDLCQLDGIIVKKIAAEYSPAALDRLELLRFVQAAGVKVFSEPERIIRLLDRLACTTTLAISNIPMPETVITEDLNLAIAGMERMGSVVLKPLFSTKARGMLLLDCNEADAVQQLTDFQSEHGLVYMQRKINMPGHDLGVVFLGGEYLATYARVADPSSWSTSTLGGGRYAKVEPSQDIIDLAEKAQAPFGLDFTCVDIVEADDGPLVFEVSAFGGFRGLLDACGIDAAQLYCDHVISKLKSD